MLYGTGVGPTPGDETGAQTQTNLTIVPIIVEIGGKPAQVLYRGRTVFPGLDQINIVVPDGVGFGCGVSVAVSSGTMVGNFTTIPVAATGNTCPTQGGDEGLLITDAEFDAVDQLLLPPRHRHQHRRPFGKRHGLGEL